MTDIDLTDVSALRGGSQPLRGYLASPAGDGPWPGVVVVHEAFGLEDVTRRQADRLAAAGYLALAVDLFSAGGARKCLVATMRAMRSGEGRAVTDIRTARQWLIDSSSCTGRVGVIGFCMGGGFALMMTGDFDAAAPNYGQLPPELDSALAGSCPVVASFGGKDFTLRGAAAKLEGALTRAGVVHDVKEYPAAGHSFLNGGPTGPRVLRPIMKVAGMGPEPASAADAWQRIEDFFGTHLS